jgi:hypothetical protein
LGQPGEIGVVAGDEFLVVDVAEPLAGRGRIDDIYDQRSFVELGQRRLDHRREFAVGQQHLGFAVLEDEGDRVGIEPNVERVEHGARHRHAERRLEAFGHVGRHDGNRVPAPDTVLRQRRREAAAALQRLTPGVTALPVDHGNPPRVHLGRAQQKPDRR